MAIEAPVFRKNVQSMLKLGRAQGVAMAAALSRDIPITEYEPREDKDGHNRHRRRFERAGTGKCSDASLTIPKESLLPELDATDALAAALLHFYETSRPVMAKGANRRGEGIHYCKESGRVK